ncbi:FtsW/RodA/SpoVE family cell cycle protein [Porphyromonas crevioricanis]|uniref:FtsW/RodA/SpoVE family cell cycle protein n=1 Tax=Porphyromonas crevioricanis TaxID=393921 RepID=UPI000691E922|nr:FtsW/RodA/SpoVE family cell cycle protein [Porphyromonas crevioricanis]
MRAFPPFRSKATTSQTDFSQDRKESHLKLKKLPGDWRLWWIYIGLMLISLVEVYSATSTLTYKGDSSLPPIIVHFFFQLVSAAIVFFGTKHYSAYFLDHPRLFKGGLILIYLLGIFSQLLLFIGFGVEINGAVRWVKLGPIVFQPSEIIRLGLICMGAHFLVNCREDRRKQIAFWIFMIFPLLLIVKSNMSTFLMLLLFTFLYAWVGRMPNRVLLKACGAATALIILAFLAVVSLPEQTIAKIVPRATTWKSRISIHLSSSDSTSVHLTEAQRDSMRYVINDDNFQEQHARIAIAMGKGPIGGLLGRGPGNSIERDILPQAFSDYIYTIIIEEWGLIGAFVVPFLYLIFFFRLGEIGISCRSKYNRMVLQGIGLLYVLQAILHFMVAVGIGPVTGQTLPLVSRGGTSYIITSIAFGLAILISAMEEERRRREKNKEGTGSCMTLLDSSREEIEG